MKIAKPFDLKPQPVEFNGSVIKGVTIRWLIKKEDGAPNYAMRYFEMEKGTVIPEHHHPWEHEIYFLQGKCLVTEGEEEHIVGKNTAVFIKPNLLHSYKNVGNEKVVFLCIIPHQK